MPVARRALPLVVRALSNRRARDRYVFPTTRRTRLHRNDGGADQAERVLDYRLDHLLAPLAEDRFAFGLLVRHFGNPLNRA